MGHNAYLSRVAMGFPERGSDTYLQDTLALGMWRRVSHARYTPGYLQRLLAIDRERRRSIYGVHLHSLEREARPNT